MRNAAHLGWARAACAVLGAPAAGLLVVLALGRWLPTSDTTRLLVVDFAALPAMIAAACAAVLTPSARRAWTWSAALGGAAGVLLW